MKRNRTDRRQRSANLMLMEILAAMFLFLIVSVACAAIFVNSREQSREAAVLGWSADEATKISETVRGSGSCEEARKKLQAIYPETEEKNGEWIIYADKDLEPAKKSNAAAKMHIKTDEEDRYWKVTVSVNKMPANEKIYQTRITQDGGGNGK